MKVITRLKSSLDGFRPSVHRGSYWANCPFCVLLGEDRLDTRGRLGITLRGSTRAAHCFNCGWKGTVNHLLKSLGKHSAKLSEIRQAQNEGGSEKAKPEKIVPVPAPDGYLPITDPRASMAQRYMLDRGFDEDILKAYRFGYARRGYFARRLIIPIRFNDMDIGYQGRLLTTPKKAGRKYMFNEGFDASRALFNFDAAKDNDEVVIVEGAFDCLRHLSDRGLALFTCRMSDKQKFLIISNFKSVVIMLDQGFEKDAFRIARELQDFIETRIATLPLGEDPASASREQIVEAIGKASRLSLKMRLSPAQTCRPSVKGKLSGRA